MTVLGIETSCDETAASVVRDGHDVLSNVVYSQIAHHQAYGGVVPEIASRCHVEALPGVIDEAMKSAGVGWSDLDAIAATRGPGLSTSLLVGFTAAKALALRLGKPLLGINHLEGHLYSIFLQPAFITHHLSPASFPLVALLASGGHTSLVLVRGLGDYTLLGQTLDDAAGEALDKGANLLGLGYPGGPAIEKTAEGGNRNAVRFPRGLQGRSGEPAMRFAFSFSGLKTSLLYHLKRHPLTDVESHLSGIAASYQEAVVDTLASRVERALDDFPEIRAIGCAGGVARNKRLREKLEKLAIHRGVPLLLAKPEFCTDNAAMIAALASAGGQAARHAADGLDVDPTWPLA